MDAFKLWCWRKLLRVPWTTRRSNQSILKEISPEYSLAGLMWKLKLQYSGHLMQRTDSLKKTLMLGKIKSRRRKGMTEDEMVGWHQQVDEHKFEQAPGDGFPFNFCQLILAHKILCSEMLRYHSLSAAHYS